MECLGYRTSNVSCASILFVVPPERFIITLMKIKRTLAILSTRAKRKKKEKMKAQKMHMQLMDSEIREQVITLSKR